ncbi:MAG TPA: hypothetical protein PLS95_16005, partial [Thermoanaerobaculales bacterium]|nr:hypothetical protein [Thermoanaerobaculales bacterium]
MTTPSNIIEEFANREYAAGFVTEVEQDTLPPGLDEGVIRAISARKGEPEWMLDWRLRAYRHWLTMTEPRWANVRYRRSTTRRSPTTPRPDRKATVPRAWT